MSLGPAIDAKEQVRQAIDIVDLVGSYVQLRRQGRNYVGLCPWHDDSRPSLQVNPERQSFKCWVCDVGGDVFSFVMKAEGLEFREALEMLAERAGISLRPQHASRGGQPSGGAEQRQAHAAPRDGLGRGAVSPLPARGARSAKPGRAYLAERRHHAGHDPPLPSRLFARIAGTGCWNGPRDTEWSPALLERVGLLIRRDDWKAATTTGSAAA